MKELFYFIWENIEKISSVANVIITLLALALTYYVFVYQKNKDKKDTEEQKIKDNRDKKIQWFKELIILPRLDKIDSTFKKIEEKLKEEIDCSDLEQNKKDVLISHIKNEAATFRKDFLVLIQQIEPSLYKLMQTYLDELVDKLTEAIYNDELKLNNNQTFEREVNQNIQGAYGKILNAIFDYKG